MAYLPAILTITLSLMVSSSCYAQALPFRCWSIADGLAQSVVNTLLEDSQGFLWIGTASGLSRFDGRVFINYDVEHGYVLALPHIESVLTFVAATNEDGGQEAAVKVKVDGRALA